MIIQTLMCDSFIDSLMEKFDALFGCSVLPTSGEQIIGVYCFTYWRDLQHNYFCLVYKNYLCNIYLLNANALNAKKLYK